jgi:hypothetical protein
MLNINEFAKPKKKKKKKKKEGSVFSRNRKQTHNNI